MSKRKYVHISEYEAIILSTRQEGYTRREIADTLGLSITQIETWVTRYNKRQALLLVGKERKVRGRPRKDGKPSLERVETELKRLRIFHQCCTGNRDGKGLAYDWSNENAYQSTDDSCSGNSALLRS